MNSIYGRMAKSYLERSRFFEDADNWFENADRSLSLGSSVFSIGKEIFQMKGNEHLSRKFGKISKVLGSGASTVNLPRTVLTIERLATGKMFFKQNPDGTFMREGVETTEGGGSRGTLQLKDPLDISMGFCVLGARNLGLLNWLHDNKIADWGKHAERMNKANLGLWAIVITIDIFQNIRTLRQEQNRENLKKIMFNNCCDALDLTSIVAFGLFDLGRINRGFKIADGVLSLISNFTYLVNQGIYYS